MPIKFDKFKYLKFLKADFLLDSLTFIKGREILTNFCVYSTYRYILDRLEEEGDLIITVPYEYLELITCIVDGDTKSAELYQNFLEKRQEIRKMLHWEITGHPLPDEE